MKALNSKDRGESNKKIYSYYPNWIKMSDS